MEILDIVVHAICEKKAQDVRVYGQDVWDLDMIRLHLTIFCRERPSIGKMKRSD